MAKKKEPDRVDDLINELTKDATAEELLKDSGLLKDLKKRLIERALDAEITDHLGYGKHSPEGHGSGNSRNGKNSKRVIDGDGEFEIDVPRDRNGEFEPKLIRKRQVRLPGFDDKVLSLYARGMTTREMQSHLQELYDVEVSPALISKVTDAVLDEVKAWQSRPLDAAWPIVYLDAIHLKTRTEGRVQTRRARHPDRGGRRADRVPGRDRQRVPQDRGPVVRGAHGPQLAALRALEGQAGHAEGSAAGLPGRHRGSRGAGARGVREGLGRAVPDGGPVVAQPLAERDPVLQLPRADPEGDLHDQRGRVAELPAAEGHAQARGDPH